MFDIRVSVPKHAVSIYWLNRQPFTLYAEEWNAVFDAAHVIRYYIACCHPQFSCRCSAETRQQLRDSLERGDILRETRRGSLWCRKSQKGAISLYGLRRFPVTLYCDQWLRVLDGREEIEDFIRANDPVLGKKGCCVPRPRSTSNARRIPTVVGPDNIIRPLAAMSERR